jgi:hypothetical protein
MKNIFLLVCSIFLFSCVNKLSVDPRISVLQENAIKTNPVYFHSDDDFIFIGEIEIDSENSIIFAINRHFWGNERMTGRLLLFNSSCMLIGMYNSISDIPVIEDKKLVFPFPENIGNTIDFSHGIPSSIWLDGYVIEYSTDV